MENRKCRSCGVEYEAATSNQAYCSVGCRQREASKRSKAARAKKSKNRVCVTCGKEFVPETNRQQYCQRECRISLTPKGHRAGVGYHHINKRAKKRISSMPQIYSILEAARAENKSYGLYVGEKHQRGERI